MQNPWDFLKQEINKQVKKITKIDVMNLIEEPTIMGRGDLALPCFALAKKFAASPQEISEDIVKKIKIKYFNKIESVGPYVNFYIDWSVFGPEVLKSINNKYGSNEIGKGKSVIVDMISLNPNKTAHIGHVRNACLSNSVINILRASGYKVTGQSYVNDLGIPTTALFWAVKNIPKKLPKRKGLLSKEDHWQGAVYSFIDDLVKKNEKTENEIRKLLSKLESGEHPKLNKEQRQLAERCLKAQNETWKRLGVWFDLLICESDIVFSGLFEKTFEKLKKKNAVYFETKEGSNKDCWLLKLSQFSEFEGMENPDKILLKSDGTTTYTANDIGLHMWKFGLISNILKFKILTKTPEQWITSNEGKILKLKFNKAIDVVGNEQSYVMQSKYRALKSIGYEKEFKNSHHLGHGLVGFGGKSKLSSREGTEGLSADEIFVKVVEKAYKEVKKRKSDIKEAEKKKIAEKVGMGAIKYWMVKTHPIKFITFDWDEALKFEGNTGPYLQYTYARAGSILKKSKTKITKYNTSLLTDPREMVLLKLLSKYPTIIEKAAREIRPHDIANYIYTLAENFNNFYQNVPVLKADKDLKIARLKLVDSVKTVIANGLNLLGISTLDKM